MRNASNLTKQQLAVVQNLIYNDCHLLELAGIMGLALPTLHAHISAARQKMNVTTTHGLIVACLQQRLVYIARPPRRRNLKEDYEDGYNL